MSAKKLRHLNRRRWLAQGVGWQLPGWKAAAPQAHQDTSLTDVGAPPGDAGDLVGPFLQAGLPPSTRLPLYRSYPMEATVSVHPSQPQTFRGLFIFKCCLSWTQVLILRGKSNFLTGTHSPSPTAPPLLSQHSDAFSSLWAGKVQSHVLPHALVISERASWSVSHSKRKR